MEIDMKTIKLFLFFLVSINLYGHRIAGIKLEVEALENNQIHITGKFQKSQRILVGNKIKLISMIDNRILFEAKEGELGLITNIPKESYWIYLIVRDNDIVINGIAPKNGFETKVEKEPRAYLYSLSFCLFFIFITIFIFYKKRRIFLRIE
jgi:hypothetical protein